MAGGEALPVTAVEGGVGAFEWAPDGRRIALLRTEPEADAMKTREKEYGRFAVEDADYRQTHLWVVDVDPAGDPAEPTRLTGADDPAGFTVGSFEWAPDGRRIAFQHRPDPLINSWVHADLSVVELGTGEVRSLVTEPGSQSGVRWSPDGEWVLFGTTAADTSRAFFLNNELARVPADGGAMEILTGDFDEDVSAVDWLPDGIVFTAWRGVRRRPFLLAPDTREITDLPVPSASAWSLDFTPDGARVAFTGEDPTSLGEVYVADTGSWQTTKVTDMTAQIADWRLGTSEVISWTSRDGATIEGVLRKPPDYDPSRRYPVLVTIHGGPTGISRPSAVSGYVYPHAQWLAKGALILEPNYRGSAGYGEAFRRLNVRNLGVGDAWDVLSGVDHLVDEGLAHPDSLGAMGWSQGGYISAFLTTTSDRFR
ncbi:MAG: prolyl oligopeptidase family serine peptidase, partial [Gemmatimonadetes bacterium]|nr:S9 family peptidase [Gemmatimonadota bacterium]NIX44077.1 prolyl oligopeptidase family serine peptidase [Gemmatimonadota bacterium]